MNQWFKVNEKLPKENTEVIVMISGNKTPTALWFNGKHFHQYNDFENVFDVTHWMSMPEPPEE